MGEPKGPGQLSQKSTVSIEKKSKELLYAQIDHLIEKLSVKYKIDVAALAYLTYADLPKVIEVFGTIDNLKDKRILDIGCGGTLSVDAKTGRQFEPWLCRALLELGANPVGVDIRDLKQEKFEHHKLDLSKPEVLNIFPDKSFDAINLDSFFDSPSLLSQVEHPFGDRFRAKLEGRELEDRIGKLETEIGAQIKRLLKKDGLLLNIKNAWGDDDIREELGL